MKQIRGKKFLSGFTLIELMTSIAVITIVSSIVFANFSSAEKSLALKRATYQVMQDLRETQEMALASVSRVDCGGGKNICGFGLKFNKFNEAQYPNSYLIFADCANDCGTSNYKYTGADKDVKRVYLEKNITIQSVSPANSDVVFTAPDPIVWINAVNWGLEEVITLQSPQGDIRTVKVNSTGRVEIE